MVVVFGGVGNLWGTTLGALTLGIVNKFLEPIAGAVLGKIVVLILLILLSSAAARHVPAQGTGGGVMKLEAPEQKTVIRLPEHELVIVRVGCAILVALLLNQHLNSRKPSALHMLHLRGRSLGKYLCLRHPSPRGRSGLGLRRYSLSLGHAAFFALGGYAMGMYLMRQIGTRGVYGNPVLPDFMVFLNWKELPWFWYGFNMFWLRRPAHG